MKKVVKYITLIVLSFFAQKNFAQITIAGATCIVPNALYQYVVSGNLDSVSQVRVCITQGLLVSSSDSEVCETFTGSVDQLFVTWNDSVTDIGNLTATSTIGNASLIVHFAGVLVPGSIDTTSKNQIINLNTIPAEIVCSSDSGGSCSPLYEHQWQSSLNAVLWIDMPGATDSNLVIDSALTQTTFFRRKVTDMNSGSIGYSDMASVLVVLPQADSSAFIKNSESAKDKNSFGVLQAYKISHYDLATHKTDQIEISNDRSNLNSFAKHVIKN